ncbi:uncharacterized protein BJX67DRAFT_348662 [Aspergillus lucknowensis]|uniref:Uncharacterized protein n=1 Tax=Aspergillus lucknowensis TaxID=176173 RepID=A0ABR4LWY2_9EURO
MTHNTTHSTELITVGINIFVAIQYQGYTQFEQEISKVWVGKIQELLHGDLRDRAMQSFVAGCLNEISYRLKCGDLPRVSRHITTISSMAELGDEEFVEAWAVITGSIIHGLMAPGVGEGLQQVLGEWMSDLTPWRLQVLAEFLRQAKEDQTSLPPFIAVIGPRVLEEITKRGLRGGLKMEDFCIRAKA